MRKKLSTSGLALATVALFSAGAFAEETKRRGDGNRGEQERTEQRTEQKRGGTTSEPTKRRDPAPKTEDRDTSETRNASTRDGNRWGFGWGLGRGNETPGIDRRQVDQSHDIERGRRNGSLTEREAQALRVEQARIADMERRAKADGRVSEDERRSLRQAQRDADRHIWEESHDRERDGRGGWRPRGGWFGRW